MSSDVLLRVMDAVAIGDPVRKLILLAIADCTPPDGRGEACTKHLQAFAEIDRYTLEEHLAYLRDEGVMIWMDHPEDRDAIVFKLRFDHPIWRRAK
jgi:hypothetical protein